MLEVEQGMYIFMVGADQLEVSAMGVCDPLYPCVERVHQLGSHIYCLISNKNSLPTVQSLLPK